MRRTWLIFSQAVTVALAILFVVATLKPEWLGRNPVGMLPQVVTLQTEAPAPAASGAPPRIGYAAAASRAAPAVVSIAARNSGTPRADGNWRWHFFGGREPPTPRDQVGIGSGVIVSPEGYVLTNHHVIESADDITVRLPDGREAAASVVGTDPESDLAVLRIQLDNLPAVTFGQSDSLRVGDVVLAIGHPFDVGQTVTTGIVSGLERTQLGLSTFENFIQTDAAINPGNSGGALVDAEGTLVGINTAIYSKDGGSLGIGFAIPADTARRVLEDLIRSGEVRRGWIGVELVQINPELARSLDLPVEAGVLISGVLQDGPASKAGMRPGDVVLKVNGQPVPNRGALLNRIGDLSPGSAAQVEVARRGEPITLNVSVAQRPRGSASAPPR
jgi:serine protease DegQ